MFVFLKFVIVTTAGSIWMGVFFKFFRLYTKIAVRVSILVQLFNILLKTQSYFVGLGATIM